MKHSEAQVWWHRDKPDNRTFHLGTVTLDIKF